MTPAAGRDLEPEVTIANGQVLGADQTPPQSQLHRNLRLKVDGSDEPLMIQLGPGWYLDERGLEFRPDEQVVVRGHRKTSSDGREVLVATEIEHRGQTHRLRDSAGRPLWEQNHGPKHTPAPRPGEPAPPP